MKKPGIYSSKRGVGRQRYGPVIPDNSQHLVAFTEPRFSCDCLGDRPAEG
jgi:hypothetical protein